MEIPKIYKIILEALFLTLCVLLLLGLAYDSFAVDFFDENFDSYSQGDFYGNGVWNVGTTSMVWITANKYVSFPNSLIFATTSAQVRWTSKVQGSNTADGILDMKFKIDNNAIIIPSYFNIQGLDTDDEICLNARLYFLAVDEVKFEYHNGSWNNLLQLDVPTLWNSIKFQWSATPTALMRWKVNNANWTTWEEVSDPNCDGMDEFLLADGSATYSVGNEFYFDSFVQDEGWGLCGSGDYCAYCSNQTDCEAEGCYWISMPFPFEYLCSPVSGLIETATGTQFDFAGYYASNSDFGTPTAFISRLASATSPFLLAMSSWLENFGDLFDLTEAQEKGDQLGNAVPQARGYLNFFDSLFSDLPLSEILLVYLVILIGIIIFRIIRQIKKLVAF